MLKCAFQVFFSGFLAHGVKGETWAESQMPKTLCTFSACPRFTISAYVSFSFGVNFFIQLARSRSGSFSSVTFPNPVIGLVASRVALTVTGRDHVRRDSLSACALGSFHSISRADQDFRMGKVVAADSRGSRLREPSPLAPRPPLPPAVCVFAHARLVPALPMMLLLLAQSPAERVRPRTSGSACGTVPLRRQSQ